MNRLSMSAAYAKGSGGRALSGSPKCFHFRSDPITLRSTYGRLPHYAGDSRFPFGGKATGEIQRELASAPGRVPGGHSVRRSFGGEPTRPSKSPVSAFVTDLVKPKHDTLANLQRLGLETELEEAFHVFAKRLQRLAEEFPRGISKLGLCTPGAPGATIYSFPVQSSQRSLHFMRNRLKRRFRKNGSGDSFSFGAEFWMSFQKAM